jgi:hypothetical protein
MGLFYTKKKEEQDEKTIPTEDFMERLTKMKKGGNERIDSPIIENTK